MTEQNSNEALRALDRLESDSYLTIFVGRDTLRRRDIEAIRAALATPAAVGRGAVPASVREMLAETRREYRDTDAAGDALDHLEECMDRADSIASLTPRPEAPPEQITAQGRDFVLIGKMVSGGGATWVDYCIDPPPPGTLLYSGPPPGAEQGDAGVVE